MTDTLTCPECGWDNTDDWSLAWTNGHCHVCDTKLPDWDHEDTDHSYP